MSDSKDVSRLSEAVASAREPTAFVNALNALVALFDSASSTSPLPHLCAAGAVAPPFTVATQQLLALFAISSKSISPAQKRVRERIGARLDRCVECVCAAHEARTELVQRWVRLFDVTMETVNGRLWRADAARVTAGLANRNFENDVVVDDDDVRFVAVVELMRFASSLLATSRAVHESLVARLGALGVLIDDGFVLVDIESPAFVKLKAQCNLLVPGALRLVLSRHPGLAQLAELLLDGAHVGNSLELLSAVHPIMRRLLRTATASANIAVPAQLDVENRDEPLCIEQVADAAATWQALAYVFEIFDPPSLPERLAPGELRAFLAVCVDAIRIDALPALAVVSITAELLGTLGSDAWISSDGASGFLVDAVRRIGAEATDDAADLFVEPILRLSREFLSSLISADDVRAAEQLIFDAAFRSPSKPAPPASVTTAFVDAAVGHLVRTFSPTNNALPPFHCIERWAAPLVELACVNADAPRASDAARCLGAALLFDMRSFALRLQGRFSAISVQQSPVLWRCATAAIPRLPSAVFDAAFVDGRPLPIPLQVLDSAERVVLVAFNNALAQFLAGAAAHRAPLWCARESFARVAAALVTDVRENVRRAAVQLLVASFPPTHPLPLHRLARHTPALGEAVATGIALTCQQLVAESRDSPSARCYAVVRAVPVFLTAAQECHTKAQTAAFGSVWRLFVVLLGLMAKRAFSVTGWACVSDLRPEEIDFDTMAHTHQIDVFERFVATISQFVARKELDADEMPAYLLEADRSRAAAATDGAARLQFVLSRAALPLIEIVTLNERKTSADMRDVRWSALKSLLNVLTAAGRRMLPTASRKLLKALLEDNNYKRCGSDEQRSDLNALVGSDLDDASSPSSSSSSSSSSKVVAPQQRSRSSSSSTVTRSSKPASSSSSSAAPESSSTAAASSSSSSASPPASSSSSSSSPVRSSSPPPSQVARTSSKPPRSSSSSSSGAASKSTQQSPTTSSSKKRSAPHSSISENSFDPNAAENDDEPPVVLAGNDAAVAADDLSIELISVSSELAEPEENPEAEAIHTSDDDTNDSDDAWNKAVKMRYRDLMGNGHDSGGGDAKRAKKKAAPKLAAPVPARPTGAPVPAVATGNSNANEAALMRLVARQAEAEETRPKAAATAMFVPKPKLALRPPATGATASASSTATVQIGAVKYSLDHLRRTVLSWDARHDLTQAAAEGDTAKRPADRFSKWTDYRDAFLPLLLIEFRAAVTSDLSECDFEGSSLRASIVPESQKQKSWTLELDVAFSRAEAQELIRKNSLLLVYGLTSSANGELRRPDWSDVRDHALAQVLEVRRFVKNAPRDSTVVRICVSQPPRNAQDPNARRLGLMCDVLHRRGDVCVTVLGSMSTLLREFESLNEVSELDLRDYLLDPTVHTNRVSKTPAVDDLPAALERANRVQREVIRTVCNLERGFVLIQGPPGTGKTRTILMLIESLLSRDRSRMRLVYEPAFACDRVLVCAPSNAAVDEICLRLVAARAVPNAPQNPRRADVVRLGQCSEQVERYSLTTLAEALRGDGEEAVDAASQDQQARDALGALMDCIEKFVDTVVVPQIARDQQRAPPQRAASGAAPAWLVRPSDAIPLFDDLMATESERDEVVGGGATVVSVRNPATKLIEHVDKAVSVDDAFELFDTVFHPLQVTPSSSGAHVVNAVAPHVGRLRDALRLKGSWMTLRDAVTTVRGAVGRDKRPLDERVSQVRDRRDRDRAELSEKREVEVLRGARVVCATLSSSAIEAMQRAKNAGVRFETVIVDEAGQAVEPSTLVPLRHNAMRCVLVGDPKQLPPTIIANNIASVYARSLFERLALADRCQHFQLEVQYRMHPSIRRFPSNYFYGGTLSDGPNIVSADGKVLPAYDAPVHRDVLYGGASLLFDVKDSRESRGIANRESTSLWNQSEVECMVAIYNDLIRHHRAMLDMSFAILTPYTAQLARLRRAFGAYRSAHTGGMRILTVDAAQGSECDVVLLSCVRASPGSIGFVGDVRRINVAVTRARLLRIVVGSRIALERSDAWRALIADATELDGVRVAVNPFDLDTMRQRRAAQIGNDPALFDRRSSQVADKTQLSASQSADDDDEFPVDELEEGEMVQTHSGVKRSEAAAQLSAAPPGKKAAEDKSKPKNLAAITARVLGNTQTAASIKLISATNVKSNNFQND